MPAKETLEVLVSMASTTTNLAKAVLYVAKSQPKPVSSEILDALQVTIDSLSFQKVAIDALIAKIAKP